MENTDDILKKINSNNPELLAEAVKDIKENGDLNIAETLLSTLSTFCESHTQNTIINLLADIKDNNFRPLLIKKIQSASDSSLKSALLRIVWESALDYSPYLEVLIHILRNDEFAAAFEASTAIENMVCNLTAQQRHTLCQMMEQFPPEKEFLIENIRKEMGCCEEEE